MSTITLIRRIEREIAAKLPAAVFNQAITYHCRKGLRPDCDCPVCLVKRQSGGMFSFQRDCPVTAAVWHEAALNKVRTDLAKAKSLL